nr:hypothetical protein [Mycolicibacterium aichiense]
MRRAREPAQRGRLHHPTADGGRGPRQSRPEPAEKPWRRRRDRGGQQRSGRVRDPGRGAEERDQRRAVTGGRAVSLKRGSVAPAAHRSRKGNA